MSIEVFGRGIFSVSMALSFAWIIFSRNDDEIGSEITQTAHQRYLPYIPGDLLPVALLIILIISGWCFGFWDAARMTATMCFGIFLHICAYYAVLMPLLPLLRKHFSARACAMLWLIPNYLYITMYSHMQLPSPLLTVTLGEKWIWLIMGIWFAGFAGVFLWKIIQHLIFRRQILRDARPVSDPEVLGLWSAIVLDAKFKQPKFKLVVSPTVSTPLTIGLYKRTTRVVLPEWKYSPEDLSLILRHEIVHIGREDAWSKFFLVFCTAMCWFNPLMWIAMRKSAEDLELSCDETVLLNTDDATRKRYARLLLDTASDSRGFTTCLAASADSMRYRLRSITKPGKRRCGALLVGGMFFLLCMTSGYVALAYGGTPGSEIIYRSEDTGDYDLTSVYTFDDEYATDYEIADEAAFHEYLSSLTLYDLSGNYTFSDSQRHFSYQMLTPHGTLVLELVDDAIEVRRLWEDDWKNNLTSDIYYVDGGIDWNYIDQIIIPLPAMNVHLTRERDPYGNTINAMINYLWRTEDGRRKLIYEATVPYANDVGIYGFKATELDFSFSYPLAKPFTVKVESWDRAERYTVTLADMENDQTMPVQIHPAHYTAQASFYDADGNLYEAEFYFNIGNVDSQ